MKKTIKTVEHDNETYILLDDLGFPGYAITRPGTKSDPAKLISTWSPGNRRQQDARPWARICVTTYQVCLYAPDGRRLRKTKNKLAAMAWGEEIDGPQNLRHDWIPGTPRIKGYCDTPKYKRRVCLACDCEFNSTGPGNRICADCKIRHTQDDHRDPKPVRISGKFF